MYKAEAIFLRWHTCGIGYAFVSLHYVNITLWKEAYTVFCFFSLSKYHLSGVLWHFLHTINRYFDHARIQPYYYIVYCVFYSSIRFGSFFFLLFSFFG